MKTRIIFTSLMLLLSLPLIARGEQEDTTRVCKTERHCVLATVASSPESRKQGLMYISILPQDRGILFVLPRTAFTPIWMKDTIIPLDIVWLDRNRKVVSIKKNVHPCGEGYCTPHYPSKKSLYILEVASGTVQKWGLRAGDSLVFEIP